VAPGAGCPGHGWHAGPGHRGGRGSGRRMLVAGGSNQQCAGQGVGGQVLQGEEGTQGGGGQVYGGSKVGSGGGAKGGRGGSGGAEAGGRVKGIHGGGREGDFQMYVLSQHKHGLKKL
jgi:hypothetical protein